MRILLDTTYLLPLIGISINNIPDDLLLKLIDKGYNLYISSISLFELIAKGARYSSKGLIPAERILRGVNAIVHNDKILKVDYTASEIIVTAIRLREVVEDFIDCIILSTALNCCDMLLTEDRDIHNTMEDPLFKELKRELNPNIRIIGYVDLGKNLP
ncbi:MAG: PIN domain-containing protein [Sulfolobales archaeon]